MPELLLWIFLSKQTFHKLMKQTFTKREGRNSQSIHMWEDFTDDKLKLSDHFQVVIDIWIGKLFKEFLIITVHSI